MFIIGHKPISIFNVPCRQIHDPAYIITNVLRGQELLKRANRVHGFQEINIKLLHFHRSFPFTCPP